jgi:23S rRNA maturation mini-RNase III
MKRVSNWVAHQLFVATCIVAAFGYMYLYDPYHRLREFLGGKP